jgi:hypothetical protein
MAMILSVEVLRSYGEVVFSKHDSDMYHSCVPLVRGQCHGVAMRWHGQKDHLQLLTDEGKQLMQLELVDLKSETAHENDDFMGAT